MKEILQRVSTVLQYIVTVFLGILTLGAFASSALSGFIMLISTLIACPFTRNKGIQLIDSIFKEKSPMNKIKGWIFGVTSFVLMLVALGCSETNGTSNIQVAEIESEVQYEVLNGQETSEVSLIEASTESIEETTESIEGTTELVEKTAELVEETSEVVAAVTESEEVQTEENMEAVSAMEVHFIDVGQGDATLIKADDKYMLIDAGDNSKGTTVQNYMKKQGVKKLDYLILTHTDADHIGGADVIITKFDINTLFIGDFKKDNKTYEELMDAIEYKNLKYSTPAVGNEYKLGNATFTIVAPNTTYDEPNNCSIALLLENGEDTFLFTGDCEEEAETDILANGIDIDCDVYKIGHHGSKTASSKNFLKVITPTYGVISCAEENSYGHPHAEVLNNLRSMSVKVFRTDEQGSIIAYSNGTEITWNSVPSESWKAGEPKENSTKKAEAQRGVESTPKTSTAPAPKTSTAPTPSEPVEQPPVVKEPIVQESAVQKEVVQEQVVQEAIIEEPVIETPIPQTYIVIANKNTKAFHRESCSRLPKEKNRVYFNSRDEALAAGYYNPCDYCDP